MLAPLAFLGGSCLSWLLAIAVIFTSYVVWSQTYWTRRGIVQTRPRFFLGDLYETLLLRRTLGDIVGDFYRQFDGKPYVGIYNFLTPVLLVRDVGLVKEVLVQNFTSFQNNATVFPAGKEEVLSDNPFMADASRWKVLRTRVSHEFTPSRVRLALSDVVESARRLVVYLEGSKPNTSHDATVLAKRFTAHASLRALFGIESHSLEVGSEPGVFYEMGEKIFNGDFMSTLRFIAFANCPILLNILGYRFVSKDMLDFFRKLLRDSVEYRSKENISRDDFVQNMAKQILVDGKVDEAALRKTTSQTVNTYIETFETSGLVIAATLLMLATNPKEQDKVREELRAKMPEGKPFDESVMTSLTYLEQAVNETLRIHSPLNAARRMCTKATTLQDPSGASRTVNLRPGDLVYVPVDALHMDPAFYSHPDQFRPEHFSAEEVESRPKCAFLGFGDGPRQCPGMRFAMQAMKAALASVLLRFEVTPAPEQVLPVQRDPASPILGFKGGVWLRFRALP